MTIVMFVIGLLIAAVIIPLLRKGRKGVSSVDRSIILSSSPRSSQTPRHFGQKSISIL